MLGRYASAKGSILLVKTFLAQRMFRRVLPGMAALFLLTLMLALWTVALLLIGIYLLHQYLLTLGWAAMPALATTAGAGLVIEIAFVLAICRYYRTTIRAAKMGTGPVTEMIDAFMRGFEAKD